MALAVVLVLLIGMACRAAEMSVADIARANQQSLQSLHSLEAHLQIYLQLDSGAQHKLHDLKWYLQHEDERVRYELWEADRLGEVGDISNGRHGFKCLTGFDPAKPPTPTERTRAQGIMGSKRPENQAFPMKPRAYLALGVAYFDRFWSLSDLVRDSQSSTLTTRPPASKDGTLEIRFSRPDFEVMVEVDPAKSFMIRKFDLTTSATNKIRAHSTCEVLKFDKVENDIYLPTETVAVLSETQNGLTGSRHLLTKCQYKSVNQELDPKMLEVDFPRYLHGYDEARRRPFIWGEGQPFGVYATNDEYRAAREQLRAEELPARRSSRGRFVVLMMLGASSVAALIFLLRRSWWRVWRRQSGRNLHR